MNLKHKGVAESSSTSPQIMGDNSVVNLSRDESEPSSCVRSQILDWDPRAMLNSLSVLEQKIHQVQGIVHSIANHGDQFSNQANKIVAQQQLVTADLTCIIIQLITTAGTLLPSTKSLPVSSNATTEASGGSMLQAKKLSELEEIIKGTIDCRTEGDVLIKSLQNGKSEAAENSLFEEGDLKDAHDGSYEVLQLEIDEILAFHTHFCMICGKGFKRDANLRMHMRGHGNEYKSPASLAKPPAKELSSGLKPNMRYSCPFSGCKRNKDHKKFLPLKTILCVKNHYKRSHCDKRYTCSRCHSKKFSVLADLKTHEKHCGRDNWLCSCGTTFSRKDKLFGHVALFQGHAPMLYHLEVCKASEGLDGVDKAVDAGDVACKLGARSLEEGRSLFSPIEFDSYCFGGIGELARQAFDVSEGPFCFPGSGSSNFMLRDDQNLNSNQLG